jgi:hypothetical protein
VEAFHLYGLPFRIGHLYTILRNHFYRGQIKHCRKFISRMSASGAKRTLGLTGRKGGF